jgi:hypothetical protein
MLKTGRCARLVADDGPHDFDEIARHMGYASRMVAEQATCSALAAFVVRAREMGFTDLAERLSPRLAWMIEQRSRPR